MSGGGEWLELSDLGITGLDDLARLEVIQDETTLEGNAGEPANAP